MDENSGLDYRVIINDDNKIPSGDWVPDRVLSWVPARPCAGMVALNQVLEIKKGELFAVIQEGSHHYNNGFRPCRQDTKSIYVGVVGGSLEQRENGEIALPVALGAFGVEKINFHWDNNMDNLIEKISTPIILTNVPGVAMIRCGAIRWELKTECRGDVFTLRCAQGLENDNAVSEVMIGTSAVRGWLNGSDVYRSWGYRPLALVMSCFLGQPLDSAAMIKSLATDDEPDGNRGRVLNFHLEYLYRKQRLEGVSDKCLEAVRQFLSEKSRASTSGNLTRDSFAMGNILI